jgi:hypothetical protein
LIILLTVFSIFLCGIVVTYVANANNYKKQYDDLRYSEQAARAKARDALEQLNEAKKVTDQQKAELSEQITSLKITIEQLEGKIRDAERAKAIAEQEESTWKALAEAFHTTNEKQGQLWKNAVDKLTALEAERIKERKELQERTQTLLDKMAIIATLEADKKRLIEEKTGLRTKLDQLLAQYGKVAAPVTPITPVIGKARPAPALKAIGLKGTVAAVDSKNSLAEISIGAASGVKQNMKFHVIRGDEFICDILILDVDADKAVGILDLVQKQPKVGDLVSTNF